MNPRGAALAACGVCLALSFCGWAVQLGGVASLQAACAEDLTLDLNDMDVIKENLSNMKLLVGAINPAGNAVPNVVLQQSLGLSLKIMKALSYRSTTGVFSLTPDLNCSLFYRYQWMNAAVQFFAIVLAVGALMMRRLYSGRLAVCCMLVVASIISIENAHTFLNVKDTAPDLTLLRGKVFFAGCIFTVACNLVLTLILGFEPEQAASPRGSESGSGLDTKGGKGYTGANNA